MGPPESLASALTSLVVASDATYNDNLGEPTATSLAALEVATHDESLSDATGMPSPVFGAYADAEAKLRSLNDLFGRSHCCWQAPMCTWDKSSSPGRL